MSPLMLVVAVVPLVVYMAAIPLTGPAFDYWTGQRTNFDFFSHYKARLFIGLAAAALVSGVVVLVRRGETVGRIPLVAAVSMFGYACFAFGSALSSAFPSIAWGGFVDRYEGLCVLLGYLVVAAAAWVLCGRGVGRTAVVSAFTWSALIVGVIGLLQALGLDVFQSNLGRRMILPSDYQQSASAVAFTLPSRVIYATLYHYNYVGQYTAMAMPFFLALVLGGAPGWSRVLAGGAGAVVAFNWLACGSRAGLTGGFVGLAVLAVVERRRITSHRRMLAVAACAALALAVVTDFALSGRVRDRLGAAATDAVTLALGRRTPPPGLPIRDVRIDGHRLQMRTPQGVLSVTDDGGRLRFVDEAGKELAVVLDAHEGRITIPDDRFRTLAYTLGRLNGQPAVVVRDGEFSLNFLITDSGFLPALNSGRIMPPDPTEAWLFKGREALGSARAYIWSRTLPLLGDAVWLGYGPDTFAAVFPQHDLEGKYQVYGTTNMIVDKAHNMFLQTAVNTGVASAILLTIVFGWYLAVGVRLWVAHRPQPLSDAVGVACFVGLAGYLTAGFFNDSVVSVAPVFWVLFGTGMRANRDRQIRFVTMRGRVAPEPAG